MDQNRLFLIKIKVNRPHWRIIKFSTAFKQLICIFNWKTLGCWLSFLWCNEDLKSRYLLNDFILYSCAQIICHLFQVFFAVSYMLIFLINQCMLLTLRICQRVSVLIFEFLTSSSERNSYCNEFYYLCVFVVNEHLLTTTVETHDNVFFSHH